MLPGTLETLWVYHCEVFGTLDRYHRAGCIAEFSSQLEGGGEDDVVAACSSWETMSLTAHHSPDESVGITESLLRTNMTMRYMVNSWNTRCGARSGAKKGKAGKEREIESAAGD